MNPSSLNALEIKLPCCEICGHVGAVPQGHIIRTKVTSYCTGPVAQRHKKTRMVPKRFVAAPEDGEVVASIGTRGLAEPEPPLGRDGLEHPVKVTVEETGA